uniref:Uncharacterized protein n=1 Tax=Anguilla anguilla TaxID=7936 RepID=A0A0E9XQW7_ANGAN
MESHGVNVRWIHRSIIIRHALQKNISTKDALVVPCSRILQEPPSSLEEHLGHWNVLKDGAP